MKTFVKLLILVPIAVVVLAFALANRGLVSVSFDPLGTMPAAVVAAPMFIVLFAAVMVGILVGGSASWLTQARHRRAARNYRHEAERLRAEVARLRDDAGQPRGASMRLVAGGRSY